ncbi:MAG: hypothetical protein ACKVZJ_07145 [Phycisphaerales bacterium]
MSTHAYEETPTDVLRFSPRFSPRHMPATGARRDAGTQSAVASAAQAQTFGPSRPFAPERRDGETWTTAGQAWRSLKQAGLKGPPTPAHLARVALVNRVITAVRRHERGIESDENLARVLHEAMSQFHVRVA